MMTRPSLPTFLENQTPRTDPKTTTACLASRARQGGRTITETRGQKTSTASIQTRFPHPDLLQVQLIRKQQESAMPPPASRKQHELSRHDQRREQDRPSVDMDALAVRETRNINILRFVVLLLLLSVAALASFGVYSYTANYEKERFEDSFTTNAQRIIDSFQDAVERRLGAISSMSDAITSHALTSEEEFPRVTLPNFEVRGSDLRVLAGALSVHWMPLVTDDKRLEWEEYALGKRSHIDVAFEEEARLRNKQDKEFGLALNYTGSSAEVPLAPGNATVLLEDGTRYHPKIWSKGETAPRADEPEGSGPFIPMWQRSPINALRQASLNINFANTFVFNGNLPTLIQSKEAIMTRAVIPRSREVKAFIQENLEISQYRQDAERYLDDPMTLIVHPVFDSFEEDRQVAGAVAVNMYWGLFFKGILPPSANGYICVLENAYGQTLAYRIDGSDATYLGGEDPHDERYEYLELSADINRFVQDRAGPHTRSFTRVPLNGEIGKYCLRVYPSHETNEEFTTNKPWIYTVVVLSVFLLTTILLLVLDRVVARRQQIFMQSLLKSAEETAAFEQELNAFLAHEVRNPVAAAMSAHGFVASAVQEDSSKTTDKEFMISLQEDVKIIGSSLSFIDDFLRSMLDIHASTANKLEIHLAPADLLTDVLEPVRSILHQRDIDVTVYCPKNLVVMTDCLRLKQVMMNLGRNSIKFTTKGYIRFRAAVVDGLVELYVEDSGPGIPVDKRDHLFEKYQASLDVLSQGTGIGLSLCKNLIQLLKGSIFLDDTYNSEIQGSPGTRFVVQLNNPRLSAESILASSDHSSDKTRDIESASSSNSVEDSTGTLPENMSVLFVDDDNVLRKLFSRSVQKVAPSWTISEAASGESALQLVETGVYDWIFMDQYMASTQKQMLGTETVRALRAKGVGSTICGLSANPVEDIFLAAGADAFLLKPFPCDRDAMERELIRIMSSRKA